MPRPSLVMAALGRLGVLVASRDREVRLLVWLSLVLGATGLLHAGVWVLDGWASLAGPVSWRKPIVFGLSSGVTTLSVAWLVSLLRPSPARARWTRLYAATMALEIFLIDLQRWRGVGSHYNFATPLDGLIFALMGVLIVTAMVATTALGASVVRSRAVALDTRLAAGAGVAMLVVGSIVGAVMASVGSAHGASGGGAMKVPHAVALHAIQALPALRWWLERRGLDRAARVWWLMMAANAHALAFIAAVAYAIGAR